MSANLSLLLKSNLKQLRLPTIAAEFEKLAREAASADEGHEQYLLRLTELAVLLTGAVDAEPEDVPDWVGDQTRALQIPGLATLGLADADTAEVVAAAQRASSMRGNPLDLTDDEVAEILARAR